MIVRRTISPISAFIECIGLACAALVHIAGSVLAEPVEIVVEGQTRTAFVERSPRAAREPTIIMLHGSGGNAAEMEKYMGLGQLGQKSGFVAVYPQGGWNFLPPGVKPTSGPVRRDDVAFLRALIAELVRQGISDPDRIYLSGFSLGGFMALRMICIEPGPFAGVALFATAMPDLVGDRCRPSRPIPALLWQGTADALVPYEGGPLRKGGLTVWSAQRLLTFFREHNGCVDVGQRSARGAPPNRVEIEHSTECSGAPVVSYRIVGGGHGAPWWEASRVQLLFFSGKLGPSNALPRS